MTPDNIPDKFHVPSNDFNSNNDTPNNDTIHSNQENSILLFDDIKHMNQENSQLLNNINSTNSNSQQKSIIKNYYSRKKNAQYTRWHGVESAIYEFLPKLMELSAWGVQIADTYNLAFDMVKSKEMLINKIESIDKFKEVFQNENARNSLIEFATNNGLRAFYGSGGFMANILYIDNRMLSRHIADFQQSFFAAFSKSKTDGLFFIIKTQAQIIASVSLASYFFEAENLNKAVSWAFLMPIFVNSAVFQGALMQSTLRYFLLKGETPFLEIEFNDKKHIIHNPNFRGQQVTRDDAININNLCENDRNIVNEILASGHYRPTESERARVDNHYGIKSAFIRTVAVLATSAISTSSMYLHKRMTGAEMKSVFLQVAGLFSTYVTVNFIKVFPDKFLGKMLTSENNSTFYSSNAMIGVASFAASIGLYGVYGLMNVSELSLMILPTFLQSVIDEKIRPGAIYDAIFCNIALGGAVFFENYAFDSMIRIIERLTDRGNLIDSALNKILNPFGKLHESKLNRRKITLLATLVSTIYVIEMLNYGNPAVKIPLRITRNVLFATMCRYSVLEGKRIEKGGLHNIDEFELEEVISDNTLTLDMENSDEYMLIREIQQLEIENGTRGENGKKLSRKTQEKRSVGSNKMNLVYYGYNADMSISVNNN